MSHWFGYALFIAGNLSGIAIRVPHDSRNGKIRVVDDRKGKLEISLLVVMSIAVFILPVVAMATPLLSFADYGLSPGAFAAGVCCFALNLWLFYKAHADLGTNWSATLQVREGHSLITNGVYRSIRHPMYAAIYLLALAQACLLSNWIAGPATLVAFTLMFTLRMGPEEKMMVDKFGDEYLAYASRTKRLVPGVF
ncbi:MAG: isoprenylcysteine carboxylmethyltransferase family protein [Deltaproteobacteria bacterium]|nr:isoprenylcysteine carboxylmethyltransferase family protein [Deltaproteobacteria bacterium]